MSDILLNDEELKERDELISFIESLKPEMLEKLKTIIWWENSRKTTRQKTPKGA